VNKRDPHLRDAAADGDGGLAVCAFDADGAIRGGNEAFERLFGVQLGAVVGASVGALLPTGFDPLDDAPQDVIGRRHDGTRVALVATVADLRVTGGPRVRIATLRDLGDPARTPRLRRTGRTDAVGACLDAIGDQLYSFRILPSGDVQTAFAGPDSGQILGRPLPVGADLVTAWSRAVHPADREKFAIHLARLANGESTDDAVRLIGLDGSTRWISFRSWPVADGRTVIAHGVAADITGKMNLERVLKATIGATKRQADEEERLRAEAEHLARTDGLTGLYNRRYGAERLAALLGRANDGAVPPAMLLIDVDHFKRINDTYGHAAGDTVLVTVARRIAGSVRATDCVARWGGEEFAVLLESIADEDALREIAEGIRLRIESESVTVEGVAIAVTASIGAARGIGQLATPDDLADAADRALYAAKRRGRNQTRLYSEWQFEDLIAEDPEAVRIAEALATTASLRDGAETHHPMRVADLAMRIAELLGQPAPVVLRCRLGGWLHDVGKVAIPDRILNKPGPLDEAEWVVMRGHPAIGEEIVRRVSGLKEAARAVRNHHERWDGSGYPDGLAGEAIPIEARIVAAADAYSAMTSARPYRAGLSHEAAVAARHRAAGTQLDPYVVPVLLRVLAEDRGRLDARLAGGTVPRDRRGIDTAHDEAA
jgi:diguanylate cyclase (GGDEF)-like protein/putative nucleotidyltransferase with HDIG domain